MRLIHISKAESLGHQLTFGKKFLTVKLRGSSPNIFSPYHVYFLTAKSLLLYHR